MSACKPCEASACSILVRQVSGRPVRFTHHRQPAAEIMAANSSNATSVLSLWMIRMCLTRRGNEKSKPAE